MFTAEVVRLLSHQRHDFLNHLQVVSGFLDLGQPQKASVYLQEVLKEIDAEREIFKAYEPEVALLLYVLLVQAREQGVAVRYDNVNLSPAQDLTVIMEKSLARMKNVWYEVGKEHGETEAEVSIAAVGEGIVFRVRPRGQNPLEFMVTGGGAGVR